MSLPAIGTIAMCTALGCLAINPNLTNGSFAASCDTSRNFGTDTSFDGIRITGSQEFVSATVSALEQLWYTPSYRRYVKALDAIMEADRGPRNALAWTHRDGRMWAWGSTAQRSCNDYARTITHEGAHNVGIGHGSQMTAVEQGVLRELAASKQAYTQASARGR